MNNKDWKFRKKNNDRLANQADHSYWYTEK